MFAKWGMKMGNGHGNEVFMLLMPNFRFAPLLANDSVIFCYFVSSFRPDVPFSTLLVGSSRLSPEPDGLW